MKPEDEQKFLQDMLTYTKECIAVCAKSSENAVVVVDKTLQFLMEDSNRISSMGKQTIEILADLKKQMNQSGDQSLNVRPLHSVVKILKKVKSDHSEIDSFIMPIIQSLQFQDRVRQQMENSVKMLSAWLETRKSLAGRSITMEERSVLANTFLSYTTTEEERAAVRSSFPGIEEDKQVANDDYFF